MRDSIETKTSSFKGKKTQKKKNNFDTLVDAARDRESQMEGNTNAFFVLLVNS